MVPPADVVAQSDVFGTDRSGATGLFATESFWLGPFRVFDVKRDMDDRHESTYGLTDLGYAKARATTGFSFRVLEGADSLTGRCTSLTKRGGLVLGNSEFGSEDTSISCQCGAGDLLATIELEGSKRKPHGRLTLPRETFDVTSVHETNSSLAWSVAGFRVDGATGPVGAVEVLHPGRIWLSRALEETERRQVACLLTGMMLYVPPDED